MNGSRPTASAARRLPVIWVVSVWQFVQFPVGILHRLGARDVALVLSVYPDPIMRKGVPSRRGLSGK